MADRFDFGGMMNWRLSIAAVLLTVQCPAIAQVSDQHRQEAKRLLERLVGAKLPLDHALVAQAAALVATGDRAGAAKLATSQPNFYNLTVKQMALRMSNREETLRVPLNDFAASFIGVTRDETDARELLTGNFHYKGNPNLLTGFNVRQNIADDLLASNTHYSDLDNGTIDLSTVLMRVAGQPLLIDDNKNIADNLDPAGVLTSRAFMAAHAVDGTNRRLVEFTFREFACVSIDQWADTAASDLRIGRDIDRFPGGDHFKFQTSCKGCHTGMDGFRGAFAKWDFRNNNAILSTMKGTGRAQANASAAGVMNKMNKNNTVYPGGYVMTDDSWVNNASRGTNALLFGWNGAGIDGGMGVQSFGRLVANSKRFSQCMAVRVFEAVCKKPLDPEKQKGLMMELGSTFERNGYKLKGLFETVVLRSECH
ncbi:MAG: hypothetical protein KF802_08870 [Bdellovibrionaceae bacterium]|nr:hypothetical protein [Pseudobdellovibrionaceae bacterium]